MVFVNEEGYLTRRRVKGKNVHKVAVRDWWLVKHTDRLGFDRKGNRIIDHKAQQVPLTVNFPRDYIGLKVKF